MHEQQLHKTLNELLSLPAETEVAKFKKVKIASHEIVKVQQISSFAFKRFTRGLQEVSR